MSASAESGSGALSGFGAEGAPRWPDPRAGPLSEADDAAWPRPARAGADDPLSDAVSSANATGMSATP
jgi:hypothetical protein